MPRRLTLWKEGGGRRAGTHAIDTLGDNTADIFGELDRSRRQSETLAAENEQLRRDAATTRIALRHLEREYAATARELAAVRASAAWRLAQRLRVLVRRPARSRPAPLAPQIQGDRDPPAGVTLLALSPTADAVARCNADAAAVAAGRIAIWDGISAPSVGWLTSLAAALDRFEDAGMVGALLLAADGSVAAAGAAIRPDGGLAPRAAGLRPDHPDVASVTPVAALPIGAVMLPAAAWHRFGGLDETIASPELALAALALRLRHAGFRVLCQPAARLTAAAPPMAHIWANRWADRWADAYGRFRVRRHAGGNDGLASLGLPARPRPRALFVDNLVPTPDRDGASIDMLWYLRVFVALGYDTTLLPVGDLARDGRYVEELRQDGVRVIAGGWAGSAETFLATEPAPFDVILLYRASLAAGPLPDRLRAHSPAARLVFNTVDLHFLRLEREALLARSPDTLEEAFHVQQVELAMIARADCTILLSPAEQTLIAGMLPNARTCVIPIAREMPGRAAPFGARAGIVFVGGFRHRPNVDAILAFVASAWPLVRARLAIPLIIVGADAPAEVRALADPAAGVTVLGHVDDLGAVLATCRLTVAPLRFGAGTKGKIVTSLAAGVPCVASAVAVEGMGLTDGVNVRVADTPDAFADAIVELHEREADWTALSDAGLGFAEDSFSVAGLRRHLAAMLRELGLPDGETRPAPPLP